eukprot:6210315-Pleurochrysis_carterae.AAC.2
MDRPNWLGIIWTCSRGQSGAGNGADAPAASLPRLWNRHSQEHRRGALRLSRSLVAPLVLAAPGPERILRHNPLATYPGSVHRPCTHTLCLEEVHKEGKQARCPDTASRHDVQAEYAGAGYLRMVLSTRDFAGEQVDASVQGLSALARLNAARLGKGRA